MAARRLLVPLLCLAAASPAAATPEPISLEWDTKSYGPDGPWQGVVVAVGTPAQKVTLYPGSLYGNVVFNSDFCNSTDPSVCPALTAGTFDFNSSSTLDDESIQFEGPGNDMGFGAAMNQTIESLNLIDTQVIFSNLDGDSQTIPNGIFSAISSVTETMPNGTKYNPRVGFLALGGPQGANQSWSLGNGEPTLNTSVVLGTLSKENIVPSDSWGMHIGSVLMGQVGSLIFGGWDEARMLGDIGTYNVNSNLGGIMPLPLLDVILGVETGGSPFNNSKTSGFLEKYGNTSVPTSIVPSYPYISMPFGTCEALAEVLPLNYLEGPGLYVWNTEDPAYKTIVTSPGYLGFVFEQAAGAGNLTIKVPFPLLNLTLESPFVGVPVPYFPCKPSTFSGNYGWALGRSFLQAAYVALDWDSQNFYVAQAAGPNGGPSLVQPFGSGPTASKQELADTWSNHWTVLPGGSVGTSPSDSNANTQSDDSGLSTGAKAGIGVGAAAVVILIAALAGFFIWRKRRANKVEVTQAQTMSAWAEAPGEQVLDDKYKQRSEADGYYQPRRFELANEEPRRDPVELPSNQT